MTEPMRLRLSRRKSFNGLDAVKVARPGLFGNPFCVGVDGTAVECVRLYRWLLGGNICLTAKADPDYQVKALYIVRDQLHALRGKNLACWCPLSAPCHADVLLRMANHDRRS